MTNASPTITADFLTRHGACSDGAAWFTGRYPQGAGYRETLVALRAESRHDWAAWLTERVWRDAATDPAGIGALAQSEVDDALEATKGSPNTSSGDSSTAASSGDSSTAASSGDSSRAASSGHSSTAASSGHSSKAASSGEDTISMVAGRNGYAKAGPNGCLALCWHDGKRNRITVGYVGEDGIEADTLYRLDKAGKLVKS